MVKKVEFECKVTKKARHSQQLIRRWCAHAEIAIYLKFLEKGFEKSRKITTFALSFLNIMKKYKVKEVINLLREDGWIEMYTKGDHRQFKHPTKKGKVTVRGKPSETLDQFLLNSIWKQAGWR